MREDAEQLSVCYLMKDIDLFVQLDEVFIESRPLCRYFSVSLLYPRLQLIRTIRMKQFGIGTFTFCQIIVFCQFVIR